MQKKTDKLLDKIVKKDYNNELEKVLEKKYFTEDVKNLLLSILYKIETAYKDYEKVKQDVESKEEFIESIIDIIKNNCEDIKIIKLNSEESKMLGSKTFLVEKNRKRIICYPIERKLLYCIAKIGKNPKIVKDKYYILNKTLSDLINVGKSISTVEPMRDFNGYSWTTIPREIESTYHNLVYQNMRILVGSQFLNHWIKNTEYIMDYFEAFQNKLEETFNKEEEEKFVSLLSKLSILLMMQFDSKMKQAFMKEKKDIEEKLEDMQDNKRYIQNITKEKRNLAKEIKNIDETINNKDKLQKEYEKRNENLPLKEKIFSIRILSKIMLEEREEKIKKLEELNNLLNPQKFLKYKKGLEKKEQYLKIMDTKDLQEETKKCVIDLQKVFLTCYQIKINKITTKQELTKLIYEFRYYCLLPFINEQLMYQVGDIEDDIQKVQTLLIDRAHEMKLIDSMSKDKNIDYQILKKIFYVKVINLEDLYIKLIKDKECFYVQLFDENIFEEKLEIEGDINKKELLLRTNKKVKIFN